MRDADSSRGGVWCEAGHTWGSSEFPTQFCCEPKTALKNKVF